MRNIPGSRFVWWKHGIIYHIYVLSFSDSDNDGRGDIRGVISKLDYIRSLGVNGIWLSPVFRSPMKDFGYDVSDYYSVDPVFGTLSDLDELILKAHELNIKVILDMVMNHTSEEHPWFIESRSSVQSPKRDWYIWRCGKGKRPPNRWRTAFGLKAWEYDASSGEYYYHSFFKEQPDLNWRNDEVKNEFIKIFRFWLDRGIDGFRLDAVNFIVKDKKFRNNPGILQMLRGKRKFYSRNRGTSVKLLKEFRELTESYGDRALIGEIFALPPGESDIVGYYLSSGEDTLNLAFDFSLLFQIWGANNYYRAIERSYANIPEKGWPCIVFSNHDLNRSSSKCLKPGNRLKKAKIKAVLQLTLKGTPFIYYGEEIGMKNAKIPFRDIKDPLGKMFSVFYRGRDRSRTPMQWDDTLNAGFSRSEPWLPLNSDYTEINAEMQTSNDNSLLNFYKELIKLRNSSPALYRGDWLPVIRGNHGIVSYLRLYRSDNIYVMLNFSSHPKDMMFDNRKYIILLSSLDRQPGVPVTGNVLRIMPLEAVIFRII